MHRFANPARFLRIARVATPLTLWPGLLVAAIGLVWGLFYAPPDYLQGDSARIMDVHVPTAILAEGGYAALAIAYAAFLVWRHPLAEVAARAIAPVGAVFAAVCLVTGSLWGQPTWGTWWVWDARLTSMLVLFFIYLGVIALSNAFDEPGRGAKSAAILAIVGAVNLPIIKFSVDWWNTLHQGASITLTGSTIAPALLWPLGVSALGFGLLFAATVLMRMRAILATTRVAARARRRAEAFA